MFLAVDYGKKRLGLAVGQVFPQGAGVLDPGDKQVFAKIERIIQERGVEGIVVGMPLRSQGEEGTIAPEIRQFANALATQTELPVYFEDERFTSSEAAAYLQSHEVKVSRASGKIDEVAAILILEQFLNRQKENILIKPDIDPR